jgi:hypothetical protein
MSQPAPPQQHIGRGQHARAEHEPRLVGIPERADAGDHGVLPGVVRERQQQADAEVVAVEDHVHEQRERHRRQEDER